jgi:hypothetical protein
MKKKVGARLVLARMLQSDNHPCALQQNRHRLSAIRAGTIPAPTFVANLQYSSASFCLH